MFGVKLLTFMLATGCSASYSPDHGGNLEMTLKSPVHDKMTIGTAYSITSAVKIISYKEDGSGHGSGNYFKLRGERFILTAHHNVHLADQVFIQERNGNVVEATVVFSEESQDVPLIGKNKEW